MRVRSLTLSAGVVALAAAGLAVVPSGVAVAADCLASPGFYANNDAVQDLAEATPYEDVGSPVQKDAGMVTIVYGSGDGFGGSSAQLTQEAFGTNKSEKGDRFGEALAVGDLNGDGCYDLVVGSPGENNSSGRIVIAYGSPTGLKLPGVSISQNSGGPSTAERNDEYGSALAIAAGYLWVGAPGENVGTVKGAGILDRYTLATGGGTISAATVKQVYQGSLGSGLAGGGAEDTDRFGEVLAGSATTLAVGVPKEDVGRPVHRDAGVVHIFRNGAWSFISQDTTAPDVPGGSESGDKFGSSVAILPSCNGSGDESLLIGTPGESSTTVKRYGWAAVVDLGTNKSLLLQQGSGLLSSGAFETDDAFGRKVAASGNLAVIAAPTESLGKKLNSGQIYQATIGCDPSTNAPVALAASNLYPDQAAVPGTSGKGDRFGLSLAFAKAAGGDDPRLVVGAPLKPDGNQLDAGRVWVFTTKSSGLFVGTGAGNFGQNDSGIANNAEKADQFGFALAGATG